MIHNLPCSLCVMLLCQVILDLLVSLDELETLARLVRQGRLVLLVWKDPLATQVFQV